MAQIRHLRYARPSQPARATAWGMDWRKRWFRHVGAVVEHLTDKGLHALYSDDRDPTARLALQHELEKRPDGVAQVIAACRAANRDWERRVFGPGVSIGGRA